MGIGFATPAHKEVEKSLAWASCHIRKIAGCACAGNAGNVNDPDMHPDTCVTHTPWCMLGSLTSNFGWGQLQEKRSRHSRSMHNPQFNVSDKSQSYAMDSCVLSSLSNFTFLRFSVGIRKDCWFCHWSTDSSRIVCIHYRVSLPPTVYYHRQTNDGRQPETMWTGIRNIRLYLCIKNEVLKREISWWCDSAFWRHSMWYFVRWQTSLC